VLVEPWFRYHRTRRDGIARGPMTRTTGGLTLVGNYPLNGSYPHQPVFTLVP